MCGDTISNILNILLSAGLIGTFIFYKSKKRKERAEADVSEHDARVIQIRFLSEQLNEAYKQINDLQDIIDQERGKLIEARRLLSTLRLDLLKEQEDKELAEYNICTAMNCGNRIPPRKMEGNDNK